MGFRKGIILAGGMGSRLYPITNGTCKQLLPVNDKPMIYYPLSTLMLAGIKEFLIITTPFDLENFKKLFSSSSDWGISIEFAVQEHPNGIAESFLIAEEFIGNESVALILGDNLFHGSNLVPKLKEANKSINNASIFSYQVSDPERYAVAKIDRNNKIIDIIEKPLKPSTNLAITGCYFYDNTVIDRAKKIRPSKRGELEITDINLSYLSDKKINVIDLGRGTTWLDMGTTESLLLANSYVNTIEKRQGLKIGCPEEIAWRNGWINLEDLKNNIKKLPKSAYIDYLESL